WKQNSELDVEFDIRPDPADVPPFNSGPNLYIRIRNRRHRVTVPFSQRSKGFIWFFSFIVWFDTVQQQEGEDAPLILLLDEPGLSLHALAQADFLDYIDDLAKTHQILYTTHSPFMIRSERLHQVRLVEDRDRAGTVVTDNVSGSDAKTVFPLQAALGYTIAQNLFISKHNLLVEGPADLVYLRYFSAVLDAAKRQGLREDITLVPAGGLDKVATFIALLGANDLELAVLHDYVGRPDQRLQSLVAEKMIRERQVLHYGMFRNAAARTKGAPKGPAATPPPADVEDLISLPLYLGLFNSAFAKQLSGVEIVEADLPPGDRVVDRLNRHLATAGIQIRPSGGFNHYAVANYMAANPPASKSVDKETLNRFEALFTAANALFSGAE
ncbi:MAG: ATP-dependent nuclease, partial [Gemmataceae bacterium]